MKRIKRYLGLVFYKRKQCVCIVAAYSKKQAAKSIDYSINCFNQRFSELSDGSVYCGIATSGGIWIDTENSAIASNFIEAKLQNGRIEIKD